MATVAHNAAAEKKQMALVCIETGSMGKLGFLNSGIVGHWRGMEGERDKSAPTPSGTSADRQLFQFSGDSFPDAQNPRGQPAPDLEQY
jgi:hypothetical protein